MVERIRWDAGSLQPPTYIVKPQGDADPHTYAGGANAQADGHAPDGRAYSLRIRTHGALCRRRHANKFEKQRGRWLMSDLTRRM